jgi:WD40 repeat protein
LHLGWIIVTICFSGHLSAQEPVGQPDHEGSAAGITYRVDSIDTGLREVWGLAASADGKRAIVYGFNDPLRDRYVKIFDLVARKELHRMEAAGTDFVAVALSTDGTQAAYVDYNRERVVVIDVASGREICALEKRTAFDSDNSRFPKVSALCFNADGKELWAGVGKYVRVWDVQPNGRLKRVICLGDRPVRAIAVPLADGFRIATADCGELFPTPVKIWDSRAQPRRGTSEDSITPQMQWQMRNPVEALDLSPDKQRLAAGSTPNYVTVFDVTKQNPLVEIPLGGGPVAFFSDVLLAYRIRGRENVIALYDVAAGREVGRLEGHRDDVKAIVAARQSGSLLTCALDGKLNIWRLQSQ